VKRLYALHAYGFPGHPFPKFMDSYPTLTNARACARNMVRDGWREVEILRDAPRKPGYVGIEREHVETVRGAQ
jgi:hypothetical protein